MKFSLFVVLIFFVFSSCKQNSEGETQTQQNQNQNQKSGKKNDFKEFKSKGFQLVFSYPESYELREDSLAGNTPVVNVYKKDNPDTPPYGIHEDFRNSYISFLPEGFGVDGPGGARRSLEDYGNPLPLTFEIDEKRSQVFLLENGEPWGYHLQFNTPPASWTKYGGIFIRYRINDFKAQCYSENNEKLSMEECDPLAGDSVKYSGELVESTKNEIDKILESLWFSHENYERKEISDLIKIRIPKPRDKVESPLKIQGEARGNWLFEATAPVELVDENFKSVSKSYIKASDSEWMTEDFVNIEGTLDFEKPNTPTGFLIFKKANASGKPELDRTIRIPVKF